ncbi:MAG: hypothetical protein M0Z99_15150 [Betaproteobacteria bacterium]|nr:hypothetical protein [Betaproteobacteria bacterium]
MTAKKCKGSQPGKAEQGTESSGRIIGAAVNVAISRGFVVGREVLLGRIPGIVVGYNIASFGQFPGSDYPLVVRTALGVTKCAMDEVSLA